MDIPNVFISPLNLVRVLAIIGIKGITDSELASEIGTYPATIRMFRTYREGMLVAPDMAVHINEFLDKNSHLLIGVSDGLGN